jgi:Uncharacterized conserved protein (COG2071)
VAEELLDRAEVGTAFEQMGREGVPEPVRVGKEAPQRRRVELVPAHGEKESVVWAAYQSWTPVLEVEAEPVRGLLAERHDPLLLPLAADAHELLLEVDVAEGEVDRLLRAQARRIDELEESAVPEAQRVVPVHLVEQIVGLRRARRVRKTPPAPAGQREIGHTSRSQRCSEKRAHGGELAGDGRLRELPRLPSRPVGSEVGRVGREGARVEAIEGQAAARQPGGELLQIAPVRLPGRIRERWAREKAVDLSLCVHGEPFRARPRLPAVLLSLAVRDLLIASWETNEDAVARVLPPGFRPAEIDGKHLISIVTYRVENGRVGRLPVPRFSQLNVRVYTRYEDEPAVFFVSARVTLFGMGGALFGAPYRPARLRFRRGRADAPGLGMSIRYLTGGPGYPRALGGHELGIFEAAGLRTFRIRRGEALWEDAVPTEPARVELLLALGFDIRDDPALLYAERASFEADLPPQKIAR